MPLLRVFFVPLHPDYDELATTYITTTEQSSSAITTV